MGGSGALTKECSGFQIDPFWYSQMFLDSDLGYLTVSRCWRGQNCCVPKMHGYDVLKSTTKLGGFFAVDLWFICFGAAIPQNCDTPKKKYIRTVGTVVVSFFMQTFGGQWGHPKPRQNHPNMVTASLPIVPHLKSWLIIPLGLWQLLKQLVMGIVEQWGLLSCKLVTYYIMGIVNQLMTGEPTLKCRMRLKWFYWQYMGSNPKKNWE